MWGLELCCRDGRDGNCRDVVPLCDLEMVGAQNFVGFLQKRYKIWRLISGIIEFCANIGRECSDASDSVWLCGVFAALTRLKFCS